MTTERISAKNSLQIHFGASKCTYLAFLTTYYGSCYHIILCAPVFNGLNFAKPQNLDISNFHTFGFIGSHVVSLHKSPIKIVMSIYINLQIASSP